MSFCQRFFQKEIESVTFQDICSLILNKPDLENMYLECKTWKNRGPNDFKREANEVVAFLNTYGGLLILGTPEEQLLDPSDPSKGRILQEPFHFHSYIPRDRLRDMLIDRIEPMPPELRIRTIRKDNMDSQCITLVDIPQGEYPPYQFRGTYYVRLEGNTKPASHVIVEGLFNRRRPPYQQAAIAHFKRKIVKFLNNRNAMTALYYLILERRSVAEPVIVARVFRKDRVNVGLVEAEQLKRDLDELAIYLGILVCKRSEEKRTFYGGTYDGYREYSINPDYQDVLGNVVLEMHLQNRFHICYD